MNHVLEPPHSCQVYKHLHVTRGKNDEDELTLAATLVRAFAAQHAQTSAATSNE